MVRLQHELDQADNPPGDGMLALAGFAPEELCFVIGPAVQLVGVFPVQVIDPWLMLIFKPAQILPLENESAVSFAHVIYSIRSSAAWLAAD